MMAHFPVMKWNLSKHKRLYKQKTCVIKAAEIQSILLCKVTYKFLKGQIIIVHVIFLDDIEVNEHITSPSSDDTSGNTGSVVI